MAKVTLGGVEYTVPEMNFVALERAWPFIEMATESLHPMDGPRAALGVIAAGISEAEDFDRTKFGMAKDDDRKPDEVFETVLAFLKRAMKASEMGNVSDCMDQILEEAGLEEAKKGPRPAPEEEHPSTETAPDTSSSSLQPDVKEEAGTP